MAGQITAFVISLKSATARRKRLQEHFDKIGLAFEWYDAVNGRELAEKDIEAYCDMDAVRKNPNWLSRSAIGCAMSHYGIYQEIIKRNLPYALIFEDDVILKKDFIQHIDTLLNQLHKNEVVTLFYQSWSPMKLSGGTAVDLYKHYKLYAPKDVFQSISAAAYLITNDACRTLSGSVLPIKYAADSWGEFKSAKAFEHFRCVYPRPVDIIDAKSTIQYLEESWISNIMKWIDKNKVFPVYQILRQKRKMSRQKMMKVEIE